MHFRRLLDADETYYIHPSGDDAASCPGTSSQPFKTWQGAYTHLLRSLDLAGRTVTLCTMTAATGELRAVGHPGHGGKVVLTAPTWTGGVIIAENGARLHVRQTTLIDTPLLAEHGGRIDFDTVEFGPTSRGHVEAHNGGHVRCAGHYAITGGGVSHLHATAGGRILITSGGGWLANVPAFSAYFAGCADGNITFGLDFAYHGEAVGQRFYVHKNGVIDTLRQGTPGHLEFLPGSVPGVATVGVSSGVYS